MERCAARRNRVPVSASGVDAALNILDEVPVAAEEGKVRAKLPQSLLQSTTSAVDRSGGSEQREPSKEAEFQTRARRGRRDSRACGGATSGGAEGG